MQHAAEVSHIERIIRPRQLIGTLSREFDSADALFSSAAPIASADGSMAVNTRPPAAVKQLNRKCPITAADIDQTFILNAHQLQGSLRYSIVRVAAA